MSQNTTIMNDEPASAGAPRGEGLPEPVAPPLPPRRARSGEGPVARAVHFVQESQVELRKVTWPTREQTINLTVVVIAVCLVMAVFLGIVDYVFQALVNYLITK
jgi:preprotein translocase subunit SecE